MKPRKTFTSLAELSAEAIGAVDAEPEKLRPPEAEVLLEALQKIPPDSLPRVPDPRGAFRNWGINE